MVCVSLDNVFYSKMWSPNHCTRGRLAMHQWMREMSCRMLTTSTTREFKAATASTPPLTASFTSSTTILYFMGWTAELFKPLQLLLCFTSFFLLFFAIFCCCCSFEFCNSFVGINCMCWRIIEKKKKWYSLHYMTIKLAVIIYNLHFASQK